MTIDQSFLQKQAISQPQENLGVNPTIVALRGEPKCKCNVASITWTCCYSNCRRLTVDLTTHSYTNSKNYMYAVVVSVVLKL